VQGVGNFDSFSPLGKPSERDIYFTFRNFFLLSSFYFLKSFLMISQRQIISRSAGPIFAIFTSKKAFGCRWSIWTSFFDISRDVAMAIDFVQKCKLPTFVALVFRKRMGYRYLNGRVNRANDACISCENFVKFGLVTPELTGLMCERLVWHGQKMGIFGLISLDLLNRYSQSLHHMKAHYVQMINL